jgi:hypothetical protein
MRLCALERPRTTHDRPEAQDRRVLAEQHGVRGPLAALAPDRPFCCARWGAFSSET